jgi:hypothetical protein
MQGRRVAKKAATWAPAQPSAENRFSGSVSPVELENVLRNIDPDGANLVHGWLLFW